MLCVVQMLIQQKTACDAMLDEKNKLITEYQTVCRLIYSEFNKGKAMGSKGLKLRLFLADAYILMF